MVGVEVERLVVFQNLGYIDLQLLEMSMFDFRAAFDIVLRL